MKTRLYTVLKFAVGWPLSVIAFLFIGKIICDQAPTLLPHSNTLNPLLLFYGVLSFVLYYFLRSYIWYRILKGFTYSIPFKDSNYLWAMSELKRYIPGNIWSFLGRTVLFNRRGVKKKDIGKGLVTEAEIFVIGSIVVSLLALPFLLTGYNAVIGWGAVLFTAVGLLIYTFFNSIVKKTPQPPFINGEPDSMPPLHKGGTRRAGDLRGGFLGFKLLFSPFHPNETLLLITISIVALFFFGLGNYFVISAAFFLDPQLLPQLIGVFVLAFVSGYLSLVTPAGFGVREGIVIIALSKFLTQGVAAFAALLSRLVLIISELLFIVLCYLWSKLHSHTLRKVEKWIALHPHEAVVISLAILYTIYFSTISMLRYDQFYAGRFDLGNMAQTVWNTSQGNFFMLTDPNGTREVTRLAFHADFILILLAPFYWMWPDPRVILLIQTIVVASGAYFIYLLSKKILNHKLLGVVLAFAYLISPSVQRVNMYDFHAPALATTFLLGTFYFYLKKQYLWFFVFAVLAAFCKEQIWVIIAVFGVFLMVHHRKWVMGGAVILLSASMFYFLVSYAIPQSLGSEHFALEYFAEFGNSPAKIIKTIILSPDKLITVITEEEQNKYLKQIFGPLGYLSLLAPWILIFAAPDLLINLLSSNSQLHQIYYQYTAAITPFIFIAAIYGIWVLRKLIYLSFRAKSRNLLPQSSKQIGGMRSLDSPSVFDREAQTESADGSVGMRFNALVIIYILYHSLNAAYLDGPLPGAREPNYAMMTKPEKNRELIDRTLAAIPYDKKVAASNNVGAHLSNRRDIYVLPIGAEKADVLVFLLTPSEYGTSFDDEVALVKKLSVDPRYRIVVQKDEFTVFEKN